MVDPIPRRDESDRVRSILVQRGRRIRRREVGVGHLGRGGDAAPVGDAHVVVPGVGGAVGGRDLSGIVVKDRGGKGFVGMLVSGGLGVCPVDVEDRSPVRTGRSRHEEPVMEISGTEGFDPDRRCGVRKVEREIMSLGVRRPLAGLSGKSRIAFRVGPLVRVIIGDEQFDAGGPAADFGAVTDGDRGSVHPFSGHLRDVVEHGEPGDGGGLGPGRIIANSGALSPDGGGNGPVGETRLVETRVDLREDPFECDVSLVQVNVGRKTSGGRRAGRFSQSVTDCFRLGGRGIGIGISDHALPAEHRRVGAAGWERDDVERLGALGYETGHVGLGLGQIQKIICGLRHSFDEHGGLVGVGPDPASDIAVGLRQIGLAVPSDLEPLLLDGDPRIGDVGVVGERDRRAASDGSGGGGDVGGIVGGETDGLDLCR